MLDLQRRHRRLGDRFWDKVWKAQDGCWLWTASGVTAKNGMFYGRYLLNRRTLMAHRVAYEDAFGPIPEGLEIDHLCRQTSCVNPHHLEAVTHTENVRRGVSYWTQRTHCKNGHEYTAENTRRYKGTRFCRACQRERMRRYRLRKGAA